MTLKYLEHKVNKARLNLKAFDKFGKTREGLTPDFVKVMPLYQSCKKELNKALKDLQSFRELIQ